MNEVSLQELRDTVQRMEERFRSRQDELSRKLMAAYDELVPRFANDLRNERDVLLSRGGALMLIQELLLPASKNRGPLQENRE